MGSRSCFRMFLEVGLVALDAGRDLENLSKPRCRQNPKLIMEAFSKCNSAATDMEDMEEDFEMCLRCGLQ